MSNNVGVTIKEIGLNKIKGGHLAQIIRFDHEVISPISEDEFIFGGDRLIFLCNDVEKVLSLRDTHGFINATHHVFSIDEIEKKHKMRNRKLRIGSLGFRSSLLGKRMCDSSFEEDNQVVLIAIARHGEVVKGSPRETELKAGDTLLLECPAKLNISKISNSDLHEVEDQSLYRPDRRTLFSSLILIAMIVVSSLGYLTLLQAAFIAAFAMIACRFCSIDQARSNIDWSLLMIFAGSISLGTAIQETGIAEWISQGILAVCNDNPYLALFGICFTSTFITEFTSNTATAAIFFPIAFQTAVNLGVNPLTFCVALMISVSSSFATPIGSPTHMIVYGPGGYRFSDFARIGILMNFIIMITNVIATLWLFPL